MEYMNGGILTSILKPKLSESQIATVIREVIQGIKYLHDHQIIHRDIKSPNVLLSLNGDVKVAGQFNKLCLYDSKGPKMNFFDDLNGYMN